jgi:hypothetical protein
MKIEKFQLRGNNSVCAGAFQLLCSRARAHLTGNIVCVSKLALQFMQHILWPTELHLRRNDTNQA